MPEGRRSHSAILNNEGKIIIFGGYNSRLTAHFNDIWLLDPSSWSWSLVRPLGKGPDPRRRQAMCLVGNQIFLFGGTSPYDGPPLFFTPNQLQQIPETDGISLIDHNDLRVLDLSPSLKTLCLLKVVTLGLDTTWLPQDLQRDIINFTSPNNISVPLRTLPFG